jgi:hypothetical protein
MPHSVSSVYSVVKDFFGLEVFVDIPLTSQEKKALGFILFLTFFGLAILGYKNLAGKHNAVGTAAAPAGSSDKQSP